jgi:hypothetical protein
MQEYPERDLKITRFLLDINKLMDGVHIQEKKDMPGSGLIKFEATLISPYSEPCMWTPSKLFYSIIEEYMKKYFKFSAYENLGWNNTQTVFWIEAEKLC